MTRLTESLQCWRSGGFDKKLKHELESLPAGTLPLENALTRCGTIDDSDIAVVVISSREQGGCIECRVGVFFTEIVAGCVCGDDDPAPETAHCEMRVRIDTATAEAEFRVTAA